MFSFPKFRPSHSDNPGEGSHAEGAETLHPSDSLPRELHTRIPYSPTDGRCLKAFSQGWHDIILPMSMKGGTASPQV